MKTIYYVGFYSSPEDKLQRKNVRQSIAGTMKMDFILKCLRKLDCKIVLVSIMPSRDSGFQSQETFVINDRETHVYLPALVLRVFGKNIVRGDFSLFFLKRFMQKNVTKDDVVISYHSLIFGQLFQKLRRKIGFRWVNQVEELYRLSAEAHKNKELLNQEEKMISGADGYLFVNDLMPLRYANGAPFAVSYGNYTVFVEEGVREKRNSDEIVLAYTGIVNHDRGIFDLLDAMEILPQQYKLHILGVGLKEDMEHLHRRIKEINEEAHDQRVLFCGTKTGKEYTEFMRQCDIGCSFMDEGSDFSAAFPSKIMAYLGHGLHVVSSSTECIKRSRVADLLTFCSKEKTSIAYAILSIQPDGLTGCSKQLHEMENNFIQELKIVIGDS